MNPREHETATVACDLAGDLIRTFGEVRLRVFGTSMVPSILPGDLISVQHAAVSEISVGDIVLFTREGRMFAHRMVGLKSGAEQSFEDQGESLLITRGDRLRHNDPPVSCSELLGKVIWIERGNFQRRRVPCLPGWGHMIFRLLWHSDYATYFYLRLVALRQVMARYAVILFGGSNQCQRSARSVKCQT